MEWYYTQNDLQAGPITEEQLRELIRTRRVLPNELVWREGMADWQAIEDLHTFVSAIPPPPTPPSIPPNSPLGPVGHSGARPPSESGQSPYSPPRQSTPNRPPTHGGHVNNGLVPAILATIFCCLPLGVVAIVYAAQVNSLVAQGHQARALAAAKNAKTWTLVAVVVGLVAVVLQVLLFSIGSLRMV